MVWRYKIEWLGDTKLILRQCLPTLMGKESKIFSLLSNTQVYLLGSNLFMKMIIHILEILQIGQYLRKVDTY